MEVITRSGGAQAAVRDRPTTEADAAPWETLFGGRSATASSPLRARGVFGPTAFRRSGARRANTSTIAHQERGSPI